MKKLAFLLALCLLLAPLCACAEESEQPTTYTFTASGVQIAIDAEAAPILSALGEWSAFDESPSCAFEGMDKVYTYNAYEIETYCQKNVDYVAKVRLLDDSVKTAKGIAIGAKKADVTAAYGTPTTESETELTYQASGMRLQFLLRNGIVSGIQYLKNEKN